MGRKLVKNSANKSNLTGNKVFRKSVNEFFGNSNFNDDELLIDFDSGYKSESREWISETKGSALE